MLLSNRLKRLLLSGSCIVFIGTLLSGCVGETYVYDSGPSHTVHVIEDRGADVDIEVIEERDVDVEIIDRGDEIEVIEYD